MTRKYVTTLVLETDEDPQGWRLMDFAGAQDRNELDVVRVSTEKRPPTFCCPMCGGHTFTASADAHWPAHSCEIEVTNRRGKCAGPLGRFLHNLPRCRFEWNREDDHKYFKE